ncbi:co-chaperone GroES [Candidatus Collierbacteria bacterium]|nr:co-chaperone GroES [Candidatus Collierbacteria bacterium]
MNTTLTVNALNPAPGYLLVEPAKQDKKTDSGIYLPDTHEEKPQYGTVLAVGDDTVADNGTKIKAPAKKGDTVVYKKWGGNELQVGTIEYQFLKFDDILAIVK